MGAVPLDRSPQALFEGDGRTKTEQLLRPGRVEREPRLAVRLSRVPFDGPRKSHQPRDRVRGVENRDLESGAQIHRIITVESLGGQADGPRRVLDEQELARGASRAPGNDLRLAG